MAFILTIVLLVMDILVFTVNVKAGALVTGFLAVYMLIAVFMYFHSRATIMSELISFATQYGQVQKTLLNEFIVPYALLDYKGKILWLNEEFAKLTGKNRRYRKAISSLFRKSRRKNFRKKRMQKLLSSLRKEIIRRLCAGFP